MENIGPLLRNVSYEGLTEPNIQKPPNMFKDNIFLDDIC